MEWCVHLKVPPPHPTSSGVLCGLGRRQAHCCQMAELKILQNSARKPLETSDVRIFVNWTRQKPLTKPLTSYL